MKRIKWDKEMVREKLIKNEATVCIVGLGYVGLPLAEAFSKSLKIIGFDVDEDKIRKLNENSSNSNMIYTAGASLNEEPCGKPQGISQII